MMPELLAALTSSWMRRTVRLTSGLILFTYIGSHLLNHALGLISLQAAEHVEPPERDLPLGDQGLVDAPLELGGDGLQLAPRRHPGRVQPSHDPALRPLP